jgi:effector-binding domain-containing protein
MKKWVLLSVLIVLAGSVYIFIPGKLTIAKTTKGQSSITAAHRYFLDTSKWSSWWPGGQPGPSFAYNGEVYEITGVFYNEIRFRLRNGGDSSIHGAFRIGEMSRDTIIMGGECVLPTGNDPVSRIVAYQHGKKILGNMGGVLNAFKTFIEKKENVYGVDIEHTYSKDSVLMTLVGFVAEYPSTGLIYRMLDSVKGYVDAEGAKVINFPLLNVSRTADSLYRTMVALSVDRQLKGTKRISQKRFVPYKMIEAKVTGGVYNVDRAMEQLFKYRDDNHLSIMSVPFELLITDRRKEQDTSKWVTRVCAPIS